jgi:hypothetical protein
MPSHVEVHYACNIERPAVPPQQGCTQPPTWQDRTDVAASLEVDPRDTDVPRLHSGQMVHGDLHSLSS